MKTHLILIAAAVAALLAPVGAGAKSTAVNDTHRTPATQWQGKRVAFLGDSMTDPRNKAARLHYWNYLDSLMGIKPTVHARSGYRWDGIHDKAVELARTWAPDSIDAIIIWAGTNDFNHSVPLGRYYTQRRDSVNHNGVMCHRLHRTLCMDDTTFCGNINRTMDFLKRNFPNSQIIIMTPPHRGAANFNPTNVQPSESWANGLDLYLDDYVTTLLEGARLWAAPVIDLHRDGGLLPELDEHTQYFKSAGTDRLHPNDAGHYRLARTIQMQLLGLPVD